METLLNNLISLVKSSNVNMQLKNDLIFVLSNGLGEEQKLRSAIEMGFQRLLVTAERIRHD